MQTNTQGNYSDTENDKENEVHNQTTQTGRRVNCMRHGVKTCTDG